MHYLNTFVQHNKIDSISQDLTKIIINSKSLTYSELDFIYRGNLNNIMDNIHESVGKVYEEGIEFPDKEVVRRILRLWL